MNLGWLIGISLAALAVAVPAGLRLPRAWLGLNLAGAVGLLVAAMVVLTGQGEWNWTGTGRWGGEALHLRLDGVSALFVVVLTVIHGAGAAYSLGYWSDHNHPGSAGRGRAWWSVLALCMVLVLLNSNGLHFLIAWEAFALSAYFLITLERDRVESRAAGWLYLAASHAGTLALFAFFTLLAVRTDGWELGPWRDRTDLAHLYWIALLGFGVKAGAFPLHVWLPSAHANAPSHVSAMMSGVAIKMGLYGIVRFGGWLPLPPGAAWVILLAGAVSAVGGAALALAQDDLKRLLAYCSVENMGLMLVGVGAGMLAMRVPGATWGYLAAAGAFLHVWNHGLLKALLFLAAGSVLSATGTRTMSRLGGLWRPMPWTAGLFAFGSTAISALPPLNGFVSEWLIYLGLFERSTEPGLDAVAIATAVIAMGISGALALAGFMKLCSVVFLGAPRTRGAARAHECGPAMRGPMVALAGACLAIAAGANVAWPLIARVLADWNPAWSGGDRPGVILSPIRWHMMFAVVAALAAWGLLTWISARSVRRAPTWDCGYAAPTPRMQYTSGSFGDLVGGWLRLALRPNLLWRRPRGPFPETAVRLEQREDPVLERVLAPIAGIMLAASTWVRRRQHGRLPSYILYLVMGLATVGAIVLLGGHR